MKPKLSTKTGYQQGRADALAEVLAVVKAEEKRTRAGGYGAADFYPRLTCIRLLLTKLRRLGRVVPERKGK